MSINKMTDIRICKRCNGRGYYHKDRHSSYERFDCEDCDGTRKIDLDECDNYIAKINKNSKLAITNIEWEFKFNKYIWNKLNDDDKEIVIDSTIDSITEAFKYADWNHNKIIGIIEIGIKNRGERI